ncbi:hypothetical protein KEM48_000934 [Puccinia striiformis f. sp. tritici PST-130]|nr:hypothetical protein KEM48_000934 [Puccinia striiformis f. sp. tritici PST-130]
MNPVEYTSNVKAPHLCDLRQPRLTSLGINSDALLGGLDYLIVQYEDKCPHNRAPHEPTSLAEALHDFSVGQMNSKEALLNQLHSYLLLLLHDQINTLSLSLRLSDLWKNHLGPISATRRTDDQYLSGSKAFSLAQLQIRFDYIRGDDPHAQSCETGHKSLASKSGSHRTS